MGDVQMTVTSLHPCIECCMSKCFLQCFISSSSKEYRWHPVGIMFSPRTGAVGAWRAWGGDGAARRSRVKRAMSMADDGEYDYDVIIVGCGVGGHGAALHARSCGKMSPLCLPSDTIPYRQYCISLYPMYPCVATPETYRFSREPFIMPVYMKRPSATPIKACYYINNCISIKCKCFKK